MQADTYTNKEYMLNVGDGHHLYVQDWGNSNASTPTICLHGGPGGASKDRHKEIFNPNVHRVIFFDQRGSGQSTPKGSLEANTTQHLIDDISKIADTFGIVSFNLYGYSWGSALALAYAINYPERVSVITIGGTFTGSQAEIDWLDKGGFRMFYPDVWETYLKRTPAHYRNNPGAYHFDKVMHGSIEDQRASGYAYESLESGVIALDDRAIASNEITEEYDPSGIRIEMHYMQNHCFLPDRYIFDNLSKIIMPVHIVHGRYDMVTPPAIAYELQAGLADCSLQWVISGHKAEHETQSVFRAIISGI